MAHFYGTLHGSRGEASRLGTKTSGLSVCAASWAGAIRVHIWHDAPNDVDRFEVRQDVHHGAGVSEPIATGVLGQPARLRNLDLIPKTIGDLKTLPWQHLPSSK